MKLSQWVRIQPPLETLEHGGEKVDFTMTALGSFRSCLKRQVNESVRISLHGDQGEDQAGQVFPGAGEAGAGGRARAGRIAGE